MKNSESTGIVLCGLGFMGAMHAQAYGQLSYARIVGLVDSHFEDAARRKAELQIDAPLFPTLKEALAALDPQVVDICVPTDQHEALALEAAAAGKHIFCEKPLSMNSDSAARSLAAVTAAGVHFQVGHCMRFWPEYVALRELVASGKGGRLLSLSLQRRSGRPMHSVGDWLNDGVRSGGAALDLHIHDTDYVLSLLGAPRAVTSVGTDDQGAIVHIFTTYHYDDCAVTAEGGWNYPTQWGFQMAFQAVFERGTVEYDSCANPTLVGVFGDQPKSAIALPDREVGQSSLALGNVSDLSGYLIELRHFLQCLREGRAPEIATGPQAAESLRVVEAEIQSVRTRSTVSLS